MFDKTEFEDSRLSANAPNCVIPDHQIERLLRPISSIPFSALLRCLAHYSK
jgi:hypothetical protein